LVSLSSKLNLAKNPRGRSPVQHFFDIQRIQRIIQPSERIVPGAILPTELELVGDIAGEHSGVGVASVTDAKNAFTAAKGTINTLPECKQGGSTVGCISLEGIQRKTVDAIVSMAEAGIPINITSVTEGQHAAGEYSHANGYKWDMKPIEPTWFSNNPDRFEKLKPRSDSNYTFRDKVTGAICSLEKPPAPAHWDCAVPGN